MDIDCCRNVRVSNCTVNSPLDDGICPKSSFALGYARPTENVTITNCFVTGGYELAQCSMARGSRCPKACARTQPAASSSAPNPMADSATSRFRIACSSIRAAWHSRPWTARFCEDMTITGITMRGSLNSPFFLRLGARMRGPTGTKSWHAQAHPDQQRHQLWCRATSFHHQRACPAISDRRHEDQRRLFASGRRRRRGDGRVEPAEREKEYPEPTMFGALPATGFFIRHVRNIEMSNVEIATLAARCPPGIRSGRCERRGLFPRPGSARLRHGVLIEERLGLPSLRKPISRG